MRILSFSRGGQPSYGLHAGDGVVDAGRRLPYPDLKAVLEAGALDALKPLAKLPPDHPESEIRFLPVVPNAPRIFCVGINYLEHMKEGGKRPPDKPWVFMRGNQSLTGHGQPLLKPAESDSFDWEVELCAIVGRRGRRIPAAQALRLIAGYSVFNDGSVREFQRHSPLWMAGKNFPCSGAVGPWMVPAEQFDETFNVRMQTRINGALMQDEQVNGWHFSLPEIIEYISIWAELLPGDLIACGTPSGVGFARKPPLFMQPGDLAEAEIEGIGVLRNQVAEDALCYNPA